MKECIKCKKQYEYLTEFQYAKDSDKYEGQRIGFSLAHCLFCQLDLLKEENYAALMKRLGDSNTERKQNFTRILPTSKKIMWMTYDHVLPNDVCPHCGIRVEKEDRGGYFAGISFKFCSTECKEEFNKLPTIDICVKKGEEDFTCISENYSERMYRNYDQLYRQAEKEMQVVQIEEWTNEQARSIEQDYLEHKKLFFQRMQIYKELYDKDRKYGSIDRMLRGFYDKRRK
jgi:hypothetical protein